MIPCNTWERSRQNYVRLSHHHPGHRRFMLMPFGSAFSIHNLGYPEQLPVLYGVTGVFSIWPHHRKAQRQAWKTQSLCRRLPISIVIVCHIYPFWHHPAMGGDIHERGDVRGLLRMISGSALMSRADTRPQVWTWRQRLQQISGRVASAVARAIVLQNRQRPLLPRCAGVRGMLLSIWMMNLITKM